MLGFSWDMGFLFLTFTYRLLAGVLCIIHFLLHDSLQGRKKMEFYEGPSQPRLPQVLSSFTQGTYLWLRQNVVDYFSTRETEMK